MKLGLEKFSEQGVKYATRLSGNIQRHYIAWIVICTLLTAVSIFFVTKLDLKSDFIELLPQDFQSVKDLRKMVTKVGGFGNLSIAFESKDVKASERLAEDLASILRKDYSNRIRYLDYKTDNVKKFYKDNAPLFMDLEDLEELRDRVEKKVRAEKMKNNPLFIDLTGDTEKDTKFDISDIENKYKKDKESYDKYIDGYYTGEKGRLLVMLVKPTGTATDVVSIEKLINDITASLEKLDPKSYAPDMKYGFAGSFKMGAEEFQTLKKDILGTALLCATLVALAIFVFFRRFRAVALLGVSCVAAVMWTFAITYFTIGYLNTVTAFLGAIIVGTGINYGIIMLYRYFEERRLGLDPNEALTKAMSHTVVATFGASATTAVAFAIFMMAEVKSFSQFGFIGSVGVMLIWISAYTFLPAILVLTEKVLPSVKKSGSDLLSDNVDFRFLTWPLRHYKPVLIVFTVLAVASAVLFSLYLPNSLEYDMSNLRTKSSMQSGTAKLDERISAVFDVSMTPAIVLAKDAEEGKEICEAFKRKKELKGDASMIQNCRSIYSFIPADQKEKMEAIRDLRRLVNDSSLGFLTDEQKRQVEDLKKSLPQRAITLSDIPEELSRHFTDKQGNLGTFVYVYPREGRNLWNAENLFGFTDDIRHITLASGKEITSSGDSVIFSDLLKLMKKDSPIATVASFLGVFLVVLLIFGSFRASIFVASSLVFGSVIMVGFMAGLDIKMNFFNFVALPMTFGIGVDYSINMYQRYLMEGPGSMDKVLRRTGTAVFLCSLTTIIGYFTLIIADSNALVSLGGLAIIGEFTCLSAAMLGLPAMVAYLEKKRGKKS